MISPFLRLCCIEMSSRQQRRTETQKGCQKLAVEQKTTDDDDDDDGDDNG